MKPLKSRVVVSPPLTPKVHILESLAYLVLNCPIQECRTVLRLSLDLCTRCSAYEENGEAISFGALLQQSEGVSAALTFLRCEANRNKMGDFETILEAASTLVGYYIAHYGDAPLRAVVEH